MRLKIFYTYESSFCISSKGGVGAEALWFNGSNGLPCEVYPAPLTAVIGRFTISTPVPGRKPVPGLNPVPGFLKFVVGLKPVPDLYPVPGL